VAHYCGLDPQETIPQQGKSAENRANPQNSGRPGDSPFEKPTGKEHDDWDFAHYMPDGFTQRNPSVRNSSCLRELPSE